MDLFPPRQRLIDRAEEATWLALEHKDELRLAKVVVFGSLARGTGDYRSDVDIMFVINGGPSESSRAKDYILSKFYNVFEGDHPRIDAHTCPLTDFEFPEGIDNWTTYYDFMQCVKKDGVVLWER